MPSDLFRTPLSAPFRAVSARARTSLVPVRLRHFRTATTSKEKHDLALPYIR
jgi:hypothetical protein